MDIDVRVESAVENDILPALHALVEVLNKNRVVNRVSNWGNQLSLRVHLAWRWGELVIQRRTADRTRTENIGLSFGIT